MAERRHFRWHTQLPLYFEVAQFGTYPIEHLRGKRGRGQTYDLAEEGLSFFSPLRLPVNMVLLLEFTIPELGPIRLKARVVRSRPWQEGWLTGVQFIGFNGSRRLALREHIADQVKSQYRLIEYL